MHSMKLVTLHFWVATIGIVLYITAMWIAGVMQGLMWRAANPDGTLTYSFVESVKATYPYYGVRLLGGVLYFSGMLMMAWNTWKTVAGGKAAEASIRGAGEPVLEIRIAPVTAPVIATTGGRP
jgi:cytochrome c oxidase cbb3-type subunit 1